MTGEDLARGRGIALTQLRRRDDSRRALSSVLLLWEWTKRDFRVRYAQTALGGLWAVAQAVALTGVFVFAFHRIARVSVGIPYASFVLPAMLAWSLLSNGVANANGAMAMSMQVAMKAQYPRIVAPLSAVILVLVDLAIGLVALALLVLVQRPPLAFRPLLFVGGLIGTFALTAGLGTLLAALSIFIRDLRQVIPFLLNAALLATPVAYPRDRIPDLFLWNPMATFVDGFRSSILDLPAPSPAEWVRAFAIAALALAGGVSYFRRVEGRFPDVA